MGTRIFVKPDLKKLRTEIPETIFRDPKELAKIKDTLRPETYIKLVYDKITEKEQELISVSIETSKSIEITRQAQASENERLSKEIDVLEGILLGKRQEREYLEKPLIEKEQVLNERSLVLDTRDNEIKDMAQGLLEKEHDCELKLESVKDMADKLGEDRLKLDARDKRLHVMETVLKKREDAHLLKSDIFNKSIKENSDNLAKREEIVGIRELNIESKEEHLRQREKVLVNDKLFIESRRRALLAAQRYGKSNSS